MRKLATKLTPAIKAWIKEEFDSDFYNEDSVDTYFCYPNFNDFNGYKIGYHLDCLNPEYVEVSEVEFLAEFGKPKIWNGSQLQIREVGSLKWKDSIKNLEYRIKPTSAYFDEIEALQAKAKENGMSVTINFEKL